MCASISWISSGVPTPRNPWNWRHPCERTECFDWRIPDWLENKTDGSDYEPNSLTSFHRGIGRYSQIIGYEYALVKSSEFHTSKKLLEMRRRQLKQAGKGNRPNRAESLSAEQEDRLWLTVKLGTDSAEMVQNNCWGSGVLTRPDSCNEVIWICVKRRTLSFWKNFIVPTAPNLVTWRLTIFLGN